MFCFSKNLNVGSFSPPKTIYHDIYKYIPKSQISRHQYECTLIQLIQLLYQKCISYNPY